MGEQSKWVNGNSINRKEHHLKRNTLQTSLILIVSFVLLASQRVWGFGACTCSRFHDWRDLGCLMTPSPFGAPPSGADNPGGNRANCGSCLVGQPRWWVDDPV
jgi:hypothetical protein